MALTSAQKAKVLQLLGYPGGSIDSTSVLYDKILTDRLTLITADTETLVVGYLTSIAALETQISQAPARAISLQVGDIRINPDELAKLRTERKIQAREMSDLLNIPKRGGGGISVVV